VISTNNGATWTADSTRDFNFRTYMQTGFAGSGTFVSSLKDANPAPGSTANWSTLSWNADTPAGTSVQFQVGASNNATGPFNFVGPDNTSSTFFNNGDSLAQFAGKRYLKYHASLSTNSNAATPTLHDVTVCFNDSPPTTLVVAAASGRFGGTADLSATLSSSGVGLSGKSITFTLNGNDAGSAQTNSSGIAIVSAVSLTGINAGSYPGAVVASFAGDSGFTASNGSNDLTVSKADQTITFGTLVDKIFGDADFTVSASTTSALAVSFGASGNCSVSGSTVHITGAGSCTITASQAGDGNYNPATDVPQSFSISKAAQTITFGALGGKIFGDADFTVSASTTSALAVSFGASGNCSVTAATVHITGAGSCTITASQAGDGNYNAASDVPQTFAIAKSSQTITFGALSGKMLGNPDFTVNATASSNLAVSFSASGSCSIATSTVHLTGAGACTITALQAGDSNYDPAPSVPQSFVIAKGSQTITFGALSAKVFGNPDFAITATASSSLAVSFSAIGNCSVSGLTVHLSGAGSCTITASQAGDGNYNPAADVPQSFSIDKGLPVVAVSCVSVGFDTSPHGCTTTVTGLANAAVTGSTTVTYNSNSATPVNAGTYNVNASFASSDSNYNDAVGSASLTIAKATPTVLVTCPVGLAYDNNVHACSATANGVGNSAVNGQLVTTYGGGAAPSSSGTYAVSANFTSGDSNYTDSVGVGSLVIAKANQTITFAALPAKTLGIPDFTVTAAASSNLPVTFTASGDCTLTGAIVHLTAAGSCTLTAAQLGDANYNSAVSVAQTFTINAGGDFRIGATLPAISVIAGQSVIEHITITPNPSTLTTLTLACSGLPAEASCTFTPSQVTPGSTPMDVVMTIKTTASARAAAMHQSRLLYGSWLSLSGMGLIGVVISGARKKSRCKTTLGIVAFVVMLLSVGCGSVSFPRTQGTPIGTSTVTVTGSTGTFTHSTTLTLTVR
jgi:hypothetical protein